MLTRKGRLLVGNELDLSGATENFRVVNELYCDRFRCLGVSVTSFGLADFARASFDALN